MTNAAFDPRAITRPDPTLMRYYTVVALLTGPFFPIFFVVRYCRYRTLQYRFDDEGVWMSWGLLFKREINLTYRRIQDIHVSRGLIQRWFGLAVVEIQTASASATPEMTIEGVMQADALRDFLYKRMRGARGESDAQPAGDGPPEGDELLDTLREVRDALRALAARGGAA
ncbi:MAG TPA: PH domain-containing protein [Phycisphaerales bacterium]|nr:PH domain-containing protein [Phycisphaerales bacterium]